MTDVAAPLTPAQVLAAREAEVLVEHPDPAIAALQKCKPYAHLNVLAEKGTGHVTSDTVVRYIAVLSCRNPQEGPTPPTWGALIHPTTGKALGMQLYPDAVIGLAHDFPIVAAEVRAKGAGWMVSLQHTVLGVLKTWRSFDPDAADALGVDLAVLVPAP